MSNRTPDPGAPALRTAATFGVATAACAFAAAWGLAAGAGGWLAGAFGAGAPAAVLPAGAAGALLAGLSVGAVLAGLRASQPVFLGAWAGGTLVRLAGLALMAVWPVTASGATQGLLFGYVAAVVAGSLIEVPIVLWAGGGPEAAREVAA